LNLLQNKKGFCKRKFLQNPLPSGLTMIVTLARLLTSGIKPVFFTFPFSQWLL